MKTNFIDKKKKGFTLTEVTVAASIAVFVISGILMLNQFLQSNWQTTRTKSHLIGQIESSMELMKKELQQTSGTLIIGYPTKSASYTAISFPLPADADNDGFIDVTNQALPQIAWGQTVIYHTYANPATNKVELRRTVFSPRNNSMKKNQRRAQLADVVANGHPTITNGNAYEPWNATTGTRTLFANDSVSLTVGPNTGNIDGYASAGPVRSENVSFGSTELEAGDHTITFTCAGKNRSSSGYKIGIDCFTITPGEFAREAEEATVSDTGAGGLAACKNEDMSSYPNYSWSGNRQLEYAAGGVNDYVTLNFHYDQSIETNFSSPLAQNYVNVEYSNRTGDWTAISGDNNYVVRLDGGEDKGWTASGQTGALNPVAQNPVSQTITPANGIFIRNIILGNTLTCSGGRAIRIKFNNTQCATKNLTIHCANIMEYAGGSVPDGTGTPISITFYDAGSTAPGGTSIDVPRSDSVASDWIDINDFEMTKTYVLTMHLSPPTGSNKPPPDIAGWQDTSGSGFIHSYCVYSTTKNNDVATTLKWSTLGSSYTLTSYPISYIAEYVDISYYSDYPNASNCILTSDVYDTEVDDPTYETLTWNIAKNNYGNYGSGGLGADLSIRIRSSNSDDDLLASSDWSNAMVVDTKSQTTGSLNIAQLNPGGGMGEYFQFQLEFNSKPTSGKADYTKSCVLKDLTVNWLGDDTIVDVSGYYTQRPDYGIFNVTVDGDFLSKGIIATLAVSENYSTAQSMTESLAAEIRPRNS